jgi:transcriptional regulator of acetoin/glycerol metabolism
LKPLLLAGALCKIQNNPEFVTTGFGGTGRNNRRTRKILSILKVEFMHEREILNHVHKIRCWSIGKASEGEAEVNPIIAASWDRCLRHYRINPGEPDPVRVLMGAELREYSGPIERFLRIAQKAVQYLHRQVAALGYCTMLCDANGITVDWMGDERLSRQWKAAGLCLGSVWNESREGTCGIGTALVEQVPLTVYNGEHFRAKHADLTCSCAPVIGPGHKTMGGIAVSSFVSPAFKDSQHLALQLVMQAARMVECAFFLSQCEDRWILRLSVERELAEVSSECFLAMDGAGRIVAADRVAHCRLAGEIGGGSLLGRPIGETLDVDFRKLLEMFSRSSMVLPVRLQKSGLRMFASLRFPRAAAVSSAGSIVASASRGRRVPMAGTPLSLDYLTGEDPKLRDCVERIKRVMNKPISILLQGETGTGKEVFARAIHHASRRSDKPFVAVNCAAIPESLIESELFGYKEGAFTGARSKGMRGKILQSDGGTLFLDEIGDMPASLQTRLLRVLAEREVTPLGGETPIPVDLHVICATHHNVADLVGLGAFREDLFYRLNGVSFELPPLRQRSDLASLIRDVLAIEAGTGGAPALVEDEAMRIMEAHPWPGNIRQLCNVLRYALAMCDKRVITCGDLPADITGSRHSGEVAQMRCLEKDRRSLPEAPPEDDTAFLADEAIAGLNAMEQAERQVIMQSLQKHKWQITRAVREIGISRATMYRKMDKYAIVPPNKH